MASHLANAPYLSASLTVLTFVLPGALVGASSPRHTLLHGVVLGALAGAFMTLQLAHFSHIRWTARSTLQAFATFAGMGIILCEIGALAGRALVWKSRSSQNRTERLHEP
jgi:heme/copper-type cytochrome/quinol oxidase subunit 4